MIPPIMRTFLLLLLCAFLVLCAEDYYQLLGLKKGATEKDIKKAYRKLSKQFHPDKNPGDESAHHKFVAIAEAYDALSDAESRRIYDQYGHEGLKQHKQGGGRGGGGHDPFDIFSRFFGGSGHFGHHDDVRRGPNKQAAIALPLRDFYTGAEKEFTIDKQVVCAECTGSGSADGVVEQCHTCGGSGVRIMKQMLAPGFVQQVQTTCNACGGKGKTIKHACPVCHGQRVVTEKEAFTLHVQPGMPRGVRVTYNNEADESPDWEAGDLIIEVHEAEPQLAGEGAEALARTDGTFFRRRGENLFWREVLGLREAWMGGWSRNVTHLDGHVVRLGRERGQVVQPGLVEVVPNEGMPIWTEEGGNGDEKRYGALMVEYVVVLPDQMEKGMEKDFWALWEKWRAKKGVVDLGKDSGRPEAPVEGVRDEL
ncbi:DnaJ-domain-containing protein [Trichodelitschia bisporula]|uniref:DnaJ-domain-containing protein n=1 Tax=Trichodelitschia bisporula TaxID=703511 RepID=A0A6G1I2H2_9PEZI|nr:DnaJ-domain-containing protein [Trichodelitschia bisporula]